MGRRELRSLLEAGKLPLMFDKWGQSDPEVWTRASFRCEYCGRSLLDSHRAYWTAQLDHILPRSEEQPPGTLGLALSCTYCNRLKSTRLLGDPELHSRLRAGDAQARSQLVAHIREELATREREYDEKLQQFRHVVLGHLDQGE